MAIDFDIANNFIKYEINYGMNLSSSWEEVQTLLGSRVMWMRYKTLPQKVGKFEGYIFDALACAKGTLGIQVASALKVMIPICKSSQLGRQIIIFDYENFEKIPCFISNETGSWEVKHNENLEGKLFVRGKNVEYANYKIAVFEDERYMIYLIDNNCDVQMHIYKK